MPKCTKCHTDNRIGAVCCKACGHVNPIDNGYPCPNCRKVNGPFSKNASDAGIPMSRRQRLEDFLKTGTGGDVGLERFSTLFSQDCFFS